MTEFRTDKHRNPTAFTTDIAKEAGLVLGVDYEQGDPFHETSEGSGQIYTYYTAKLLGDPVELTIKVIDKIGFYTDNAEMHLRWIYIGIPYGLWLVMTRNSKVATIGSMYAREGGTEMKDLFAGAVYDGVAS
jgi:hypothetical protein